MLSNDSRYSKFIAGYQKAFIPENAHISIYELALLRRLSLPTHADLVTASILENILVDILGFASLNSSIGGLWHEIMASPTVLSMVSDWRLPLLSQLCNPAPVVNLWNTFFQMLNVCPRELIGDLP